MLAFFAAAVPIAASLFAAGSLLLEHSRASHDARAFARISTRYGNDMEKLQGLAPAEYNRGSAAARERRDMLVEANGLDPYIGTAAHFNASQAPTAPSRAEVWRQWSLLHGSAVGVVLLALDTAGVP